MTEYIKQLLQTLGFWKEEYQTIEMEHNEDDHYVMIEDYKSKNLRALEDALMCIPGGLSLTKSNVCYVGKKGDTGEDLTKSERDRLEYKELKRAMLLKKRKERHISVSAFNKGCNGNRKRINQPQKIFMRERYTGCVNK